MSETHVEVLSLCSAVRWPVVACCRSAPFPKCAAAPAKRRRECGRHKCPLLRVCRAVERRTYWWFVEADAWAAWIRSVTGNTALQEEVVWSWNARRCAAGLTEGKSKSAQKWEWLRLEMVEHLPVAVFVIEVEGTLADLRDLRRWFRVFGFSLSFR